MWWTETLHCLTLQSNHLPCFLFHGLLQQCWAAFGFPNSDVSFTSLGLGTCFFSSLIFLSTFQHASWQTPTYLKDSAEALPSQLTFPDILSSLVELTSPSSLFHYSQCSFQSPCNSFFAWITIDICISLLNDDLDLFISVHWASDILSETIVCNPYMFI